MLSSRGFSKSLRALHNGKGRPLRLTAYSVRHLSSQPLRTSSLLQHRNVLSRNTPSTWGPSTFLTSQSQRFASTAPAPLSPATVPEVAPQPDEWAAIFNNTTAPTVVEPYIGYFKEIGVHFGIGTSSMVTWFLEHIHVYSGLPWFGSIITAVFLMRLAILPLNFNAADCSGRMAVTSSLTKSIQEKVTAARQSKNVAAIQEASMELKEMYKKTGIKPMALMWPVIAQVPVGFGMWRLTRLMAEVPVPGLEQGGAFWFTDLTIPDPIYMLPVITSVAMFITFKRGGENGGNATMSPKVLKFMQYGLPLLSLLAMSPQPASTQVYFATTSIWAGLQASLLRSNKIRTMLGVQLLPDPNKKVVAEAVKAEPYKGTLTKLRPDTVEEVKTENSYLPLFVTNYLGELKSVRKAEQDKAKISRLSAKQIKAAKAHEVKRQAEIKAEKDQARNRLR